MESNDTPTSSQFNSPNQASASPPPPLVPPQSGNAIYPGTPVYPGLPPIPPFALPQASDLPSFPGVPGEPPATPHGTRFKPWLIVLIVVVSASVIFGGIYALDRAYGPPSLSGTWNVSFSSSVTTQEGTMSLQQISTEVTGTATLSTSGVPGVDSVTGSVLGNSVTLDLAGVVGFILMHGTFSDATHISGNYTAVFTDGSPSDSGTWSATKTS
ncbi:MAG TPA: hypothetical protein VIG30_10825 [Ktedonobacterales bacterium]